MNQTVAGAETLFEAVTTFLQRTRPAAWDPEHIALAKKAFDDYAKAVRSRPVAPEASYSVGAETMQRRVRDQLGLDYSLGQIEALALDEVDRVNGLLKSASPRLGRGTSPTELIQETRLSS